MSFMAEDLTNKQKQDLSSKRKIAKLKEAISEEEL